LAAEEQMADDRGLFGSYLAITAAIASFLSVSLIHTPFSCILEKQWSKSGMMQLLQSKQ
jgi:hypothetical protein